MLVLQIAVGIVLGVLILAWLPALIRASFVLFCMVLGLSAYIAVVYIVWLMTGNVGFSIWITFGLLIGGEKLVTWYRKRRPSPKKEHEVGFDEHLEDYSDDLDPVAVATAEQKLIRLYRKPHPEIPN
jgi:hypothetical protein